MSANPNTLMIPINEYVALQTELSILKAQYEALRTHLNKKQHDTTATVYVKDQNITKSVMVKIHRLLAFLLFEQLPPMHHHKIRIFQQFYIS
jgi:hypothetical protein